MKITIELIHIRISVDFKFQLQQTILIFWNESLERRIVPVKNRKNEHHHGILHIRISLSTKFQLKLIILNFWTKFTSKGYFRLKSEKGEHHH